MTMSMEVFTYDPLEPPELYDTICPDCGGMAFGDYDRDTNRVIYECIVCQWKGDEDGKKSTSKYTAQ